ncbi:IS3 family transposase [Sporomusa sp.]|uniref:IS3 family transposase n=1 Tax=Sporomusa sp. TaxID=2078658 RepID=UPI002B777774|nr:IS3 family transposase [Sporomusa sp.]HWR08319.1 IS3 family transposase [Sporomusa sp.]
MEKRRKFTPQEKSKIVLEALREEKTLSQIAAEYQVHPNVISRWKAEFMANADKVFSKEADEVEKIKQAHEQEKDELLRQIGQLSYEVSWLKKNLVETKSRKERLAMVEKGDKKLSMTRQANLLDVNRTSLYYRSVPISQEELDIKQLIDEIYTKHPEYGYRRMTKVLRTKHNIIINCKRTRRYMREMGIHGFCPGPNLSKRLHSKYLYPYLLRGLNIDHPNQVWSVDVTYCRMKHGFMYLVAIIDWYSRYIVGFRLSNTLEKTFVLETIKKAIKTQGIPEIINSDQGSQFTCREYVDLLKENGIKVSMNGKGRALDNQRIERSFRSYKWEKLYMEECETGHELRRLTQGYVEYYNSERPHQSLKYQTPAAYYYESRLTLKAV